MNRDLYKRYTLSIIIPFYNNTKDFFNNILQLKSNLEVLLENYEIIIIDDYSEFFDFESLNKYTDSCSYSRNDSNQGKGASIKKGVDLAKGDIIIFMDSDFPYKLDCINLIIDEIIDGSDIAIGDRSLSNSKSVVKVGFGRKIASKLFSFAAFFVIKRWFPDTQCGVKGFSNEVAKELFSEMKTKGFAFDVELLSIATNRNYSIKRIPVCLVNNSVSSISFFKNGYSTIKELIKLFL